MSRDITWLLDVLIEARRAREAIAGVDREQFLADWKIQHIIVRCVEIIGEAANRISVPFQASYPNIPWSKMVGMRNILIHHYHRVDLDAVWDVVQNHLPDLIDQIAPLVPPEDSASTE